MITKLYFSKEKCKNKGRFEFFNLGLRGMQTFALNGKFVGIGFTAII